MALENLYNVHEGLTGRTEGVYLDINQIERYHTKYGPNAFPPGILVTERELRASNNPLRGSFKPGDGVTITAAPIAHRDTATGAITAGPAPEEPAGLMARASFGDSEGGEVSDEHGEDPFANTEVVDYTEDSEVVSDTETNKE